MTTRLRASVLRFSLFSFLTFSVGTAVAAANDEKAQQLAQQALFEDYLNLNFDAAKTKLIMAVGLCENACSPSVKAAVLRDLGVVYIAGLKERDEGISTFIKALAVDPDVQLDPDLANQELSEAFAEAKSLAARGQSAPGADEELAASTVAESEGGVIHTPPTEQTVNTPLPIFLQVNEDDLETTVGKVKLYYRGFGMARFRSRELAKLEDDTYGIELSCKDVGRSPGNIEYYLVIIDDEGDEVTRVGDEPDPFKVRTVSSAANPPTPLPGKPAPTQCDAPITDNSPSGPLDLEDCPPDFPGCGGPEEQEEAADGDAFRRHWLSVGFQQDLLLMSAAKDACSTQRPTDLDCYYAGGQFRDPTLTDDLDGDGVPDRVDVDGDGVFDDSGTVASGFAVGTQRVLLGYEFAVTQNFLVGGRVGFAFGGGPQLQAPGLEGPAFFPIHAEARLSYWFGSEVLTDQFFRPYVFAGAGGAQVDAKASTKVVDRTSLDQHCGDDSAGCISTVEVWKKTGTAFAGGGLGSMLAFGDTHGLLLEARGLMMFPAPGTAIGLSAGYMMGF